MKSGKLKTDLKLKSGTVLRTGADVTVTYLSGSLVCHLDVRQPGDCNWSGPHKIHCGRLPHYVSGFKTPTMRSLEKWSSDGVCLTPSGKRVEPDGFGPDGSPSWLLVLGFI